jgi:hypothetical protein
MRCTMHATFRHLHRTACSYGRPGNRSQVLRRTSICASHSVTSTYRTLQLDWSSNSVLGITSHRLSCSCSGFLLNIVSSSNSPHSCNCIKFRHSPGCYLSDSAAQVLTRPRAQPTATTSNCLVFALSSKNVPLHTLEPLCETLFQLTYELRQACIVLSSYSRPI